MMFGGARRSDENGKGLQQHWENNRKDSKHLTGWSSSVSTFFFAFFCLSPLLSAGILLHLDHPWQREITDAFRAPLFHSAIAFVHIQISKQ